MAKYVDGFVLVVPKNKTEEYKKMAQGGAEMWMRHGALEYYECMGNDLVPQEMGGMRSLAFTEIINAKEDETVWFSFIVFKSKEHRDEVNAKAMEEMNKQMEGHENDAIPFDIKRMAFGGFEVVVEGK